MQTTQPRDSKGRFIKAFEYDHEGKIILNQNLEDQWFLPSPVAKKPWYRSLWVRYTVWWVLVALTDYFAAHLGMYGRL